MCFVNKPSSPPPTIIPPPPAPPDLSNQLTPVLQSAQRRETGKNIGLSQLRKDLTISPTYAGGSGLSIPS